MSDSRSKNELVAVPFHEDQIEAIQDKDGNGYVVVKRVCENLKVDYASQFTKLKKAHWSGIVMITIPDSKGSAQEHCVIPIDSLPMWLVTIQESKVGEKAKPKLKRYQLEARDVLARHFNPTRASAPVVTQTKTEFSTLDLINMGELLTNSFRKQYELEQNVQVVQIGQAQLERKNRELEFRLAQTQEELIQATANAARAVRTVTSESDFHTLVTWAEEHGVLLGHGQDSAEGRIINAMCRERGITPGKWKGPRYSVGTYPEHILKLWFNDYHQRKSGLRLAN